MEMRRGATGVVLRDAAGSFGGGHAQWYPNGQDALTMEALAIRDALAFARDRGVATTTSGNR
jgi:hypothetical protein